jgi:hypothetical protein
LIRSPAREQKEPSAAIDAKFSDGLACLLLAALDAGEH